MSNNFDTSNVTDMSYMFNRCSSLVRLDIRNINFYYEMRVSGMFGGDTNYVNPQIIVKDNEEKRVLTTWFPELTNVVLPSEL